MMLGYPDPDSRVGKFSRVFGLPTPDVNSQPDTRFPGFSSPVHH